MCNSHLHFNFLQVQSNQGSSTSKASTKPGKLSDVEIFSGFKPAIEACFLNWDDYPLPGVTYGHNSKYLCPFTVFKQPAEADSAVGRAGSSQVNSSQAVLRWGKRRWELRIYNNNEQYQV